MTKPPDDPPRKPGRPPVAEPGSSVSTWLRQSEHDRLIRLAHEHETTVSSLVRQLLKLRLP
jgi:hypothetical protein